ncbi:MAG: hypothetical protein CL940_11630 [Deltaproteobacteria bacterium]|nr:hypothetical protein [Deltaproteobacteria bacterium]
MSRLTPVFILAAALFALGLSACSDDTGGGSSNSIPVVFGDVFGNGGGGGLGADAGTTQNLECETDVDCVTAEKPYCSLSKRCQECTVNEHCAAGQYCDYGTCLDESCQPGQSTCSGDGSTQLTCDAQGTSWTANPCTGGVCQDGSCTGCVPGQKVCEGQQILMCDPVSGQYTTISQCAGEEICVQGECMVCYPGTKQCDNFLGQVCTIDGQWETVEDCAAIGKNCFAGSCVSPCIKDPKFLSNSGCDYWAVDLDNHLQANQSPYAICVSNLGDEPTEVSVSRKTAAGANSEKIESRMVQPGSLEVFHLQESQVNGTGIKYKAYRVQSDAPIVAYQFNPLDNVDVFSNDASLLLPASTLGTEYIVMSRKEFLAGGPEIGAFETCAEVCGQFPGGQCYGDFGEMCAVPYRGSLTVLASAGGTEVTISPTAFTLASNDGSVAAMSPGQSYTYMLEPFQVLNVVTNQDQGDLTGTVVTSTKPVAVFGGHESSVSSDQCCTDHLEQQLFPTKSWGKRYMATKSYTRGFERDYWRILAMEDGTTVSFNPPTIEPQQVINRGQWFEIATTEDFEIIGDKPITVAQVLASSHEVTSVPLGTACTSDFDCDYQSGYTCLTIDLMGNTACYPPFCFGETDPSCPTGHSCTCFGLDCACFPIGDPAMILAPPVEQFRKDYVFLSPDAYLYDYVNIIAPSGTVVTMDGVNLPAVNFKPIANTGYSVARQLVSDGVHTIVANNPVGVVAYGYDKDVSYGYTAGMNLNDL